MAYASQSGRARTSASNPQAFAVCDRCGIWYNHVDLQWQYDWAGSSLINKRLLVCERCLDVPQQQLRAIVVPADPVPIVQPRLEYYANDETDQISTNPGTTDPVTGIPIPSSTTLITQGGINITTQVLGHPNNLDANAQAPLVMDVVWGVSLPVLTITADGTTTITVTCSAPHGLSTNAQVSVEGLTVSQACGAYSIIVVNSTVFTYMTNAPVTAGSLWTSTGEAKTMNAGLPYDYAQIPQTGP
jgi:hypothetical protein